MAGSAESVGAVLAPADRGIGYLLKDRVANVSELIDAIAGVTAGGTAPDPEVVTGMLNATRHAGTLPAQVAREHEVLALMAEGRSSGASADQLVVTQVTAG
jgi:DNA-binding NarL/FixJ family response regulator